MFDFDVAILMGVYNGDKMSEFITAVNSIKNKQFAIKREQIKIYLHIDGLISNELRDYIDKSNMFYKIITSKQNLGLSKGLNKLFDALENEKYAFRMDSDDISLNDRIYKQLSFMEENPKIDFSGGSISEFIGEINNIQSVRKYPLEMPEIKNSLAKASPFGHVTVCFRASSLTKIGHYPTEYHLNEDIALWFQAIKNNCLASNIKDVLVNVRMDGAYNRRTAKKALAEFKVYFSICIWMKKIPIYPLIRMLFRLCPTYVVEKIYKSRLRQYFLSSTTS